MTVLSIPRQKAFPIARSLPLNVGVLHFIGIGGIGMSGIAEILHNLGYQVQGSDLTESANLDRLRALGIKIFVGHDAANISGASAIVVSSAVKPENPEVVAARAGRVPIVRRAEMLAELMRLKMAVSIAGTHGKTTTTSLTAALFDAAGLMPTVINGGIINSYGTNARIGSGEWMVVEADESDGTFIKLPSSIAVITNIDPEHLDYYNGFDNLRKAFLQFVENIPFYGFAVLCIDHPEVQTLLGKVHDRRVITYGFTPQADVRAVNIRREAGGQMFDVEVAATEKTIKDIFLPMFGEHNIRNALAVTSIAQELAISDDVLKKAFAKFDGVKRRFTRTGVAKGITVIDDYGHHPVEIQATLKAARQAQSGTDGKVVAVVQPHRYTRLRDLFGQFCTCFNDADTVIVTDVYPAGEEPIENIHSDALADGLRSAGHRHVLRLSNAADLAGLVLQEAKEGDMVVCLGAGSISKWANALPKEIEAHA
ncbi:MAG TPA: UDP-N-acetylmuramate--L-alanine ligase [Rickettsiales bacterium]|nr:UDP-N-acetylmuramate--L-alanine ligase [Rickettsiales bacterium]